MHEPFDSPMIKAMLRTILRAGNLAFSRHALEEMNKDQLTEIDVANILRAGMPLAPERERGTWRYRITTQKIRVVVAFRSKTEAVVVTVWRLNQ